jgi:hemolysin activation/secretion protein
LKNHLKHLPAMPPLTTALLLAFTPLAALAAAPVPPNAGTILQQVQPSTPALPSSDGTGLRMERPDGSTLPPSAPFLVQRIDIANNTAFATPVLLALVADAQGKMLSLPALGVLASRITLFYQTNGYPLARAIIPAQTITDGVVRIDIIEARYGKLVWVTAVG